MNITLLSTIPANDPFEAAYKQRQNKFYLWKKQNHLLKDPFKAAYKQCKEKFRLWKKQNHLLKYPFKSAYRQRQNKFYLWEAENRATKLANPSHVISLIRRLQKERRLQKKQILASTKPSPREALPLRDQSEIEEMGLQAEKKVSCATSKNSWVHLSEEAMLKMRIFDPRLQRRLWIRAGTVPTYELA